MIIALYGSRRLQPWAAPIREFFAELKRRQIDVVVHSKLYGHLAEIAPEVLEGAECVEDDDFNADMAVSLGGDGTMLRTAMWVGSKCIPVIGFNAGHLGFLTADPIEKLPQLLDNMQAGVYTLESRSLLEVTSPELPLWCPPYALNEVALGKLDNSSMIMATVKIDGNHLADYRADGLIICTATGSTAYNLSVGGPVVQPTIDVCVISPVAAHSLSMRPMVVDANANIDIDTQARASHVRLSLDSRSVDIEIGQKVCLRRAPFAIRLLRRADISFADTLRDKLHWAES